MKVERILKIGFIVCTFLFFGSGFFFIMLSEVCPQQSDAKHIFGIYYKGTYFYITLTQLRILVFMASTSGLGIIIFGIIQEVLKKKNKKQNEVKLSREKQVK